VEDKYDSISELLCGDDDVRATELPLGGNNGIELFVRCPVFDFEDEEVFVLNANDVPPSMVAVLFVKRVEFGETHVV
jgi:hypothetical protein